jgi:hypothetical protein
MKSLRIVLTVFYFCLPLLSAISSSVPTNNYLGCSSYLFLQDEIGTGSAKIRGRVIDKNSGESLPGATVVIQGTTTGTLTDLDGNFVLENISVGGVTIEISFVSYQSIIIENVEVVLGKETSLDIQLEPHIEQLQEVEITARSLRDREAVLLLEQKAATTFVSRIGGQEISRKGAGDVASALTKMVGISKQESSSALYIRGLGDRYNTTSINGLPIPSNNPEQKNIALELFTTDIVEYLSVDKVYSSHLYGDYAGGNIDIVSKKPTGNQLFYFNTGSNFNSFSLKNGSLPLKNGPGLLGFHS